MNLAQKKIITFGFFVLFAMGVYPPWKAEIHVKEINRETTAGYNWIFEAPKYKGELHTTSFDYDEEVWSLGGQHRVDIQRLAIQWVLVGFVIGGLVFAAGGQRDTTEKESFEKVSSGDVAPNRKTSNRVSEALARLSPFAPKERGHDAPDLMSLFFVASGVTSSTVDCPPPKTAKLEAPLAFLICWSTLAFAKFFSGTLLDPAISEAFVYQVTATLFSMLIAHLSSVLIAELGRSGALLKRLPRVRIWCCIMLVWTGLQSAAILRVW